MKCQNLFSGTNKKNISKCHLLKILPSVLSLYYFSSYTNIAVQLFLEKEERRCFLDIQGKHKSYFEGKQINQILQKVFKNITGLFCITAKQRKFHILLQTKNNQMATVSIF